MGIQGVKKLHNQHRHDMRVQNHRQDGNKVWVLGPAGITLLLQQLNPVKISRPRHAATMEEEGGEGEEEGAVTPRGEGCMIPAEAATCPPAPKKPRTAVSIVSSSAAGRRCNCDDGEALEFFRVPADLEAVFISRAAKGN
ncbi:cyclin-dependent protein kinase inhibitor SMR6-like [Phragmites australis]|uniref:cyclin-dependent protein kinase inhibitor SMR6-like n=1 Tax=Phragmites australis TaxID=29695 RepID=UPI002D77B5B6|nr:cyclin-dependent protein kinase inhibitor SMR6-like [Phragmites australis]